jgi:DNA polymerase-3 subunit epsilon
VTDTSLPEWANVLAVFDTETTGIATETTRIVSAHVSVLTPEGESTQARDWLIDCGIEIPAQATAVHGITTERMQAEGAPAPDSILEILALLQGYFDAGVPVVAYNASYPLVIDKQIDKYRKGKRTLEAASAYYGVSLDGAHDASVDAIAAGRVAQAIGRKYATELNMSANDLHDAQVTWAAAQAASYAEWRRGQGLAVFPGDGVWPVR